jgi:hypothetical protein
MPGVLTRKPMYTRDEAHTDIATRMAGWTERRSYDWVARAIDLLLDIVDAGHAAGLPDDVTTWPGGHPADWVITTMQAAPDRFPSSNAR